MDNVEIEAFLEYLSVTRNVSGNTQKTTLNALIFMYRKFLKIDINDLKFRYATKLSQLPTVFTDYRETAEQPYLLFCPTHW